MAFVPDKPSSGRGRFVPDAGQHASDIPGVLPTPPASPEPSLMEKLKGAGEAGLSALTSIPAGLAGSVAGAAKGMFGGKYGTPEGVAAGEQTAADVSGALTYQPRTATGQEYQQDIARALQQSGLAGAPVGEGMVLAGAAGRAKPGIAAAQAGGRIAEAVTPKITPETAALAQKAEAMGIPLRPDMLTDNRIVKMIGEALEKVPLSGAKTEERHIAFNRAIMKTIGADPEAKKLTPDVFDKAISLSGQKIGDIAARNQVALDETLVAALDSHAAEAAKFETADVAKIINNYVAELKSKAENGSIPGEAYRKLNTKIGTQMRSSTNGDLRHALGMLQEDMHEALNRNLNDADRAALFEARKQYANAKTLEPLVAKSPEGNMSPSALMGAVTSTKTQKSAMARGRRGDLGDIAKVGQRFLKDQPSSGTAERSLGYGLLGGGAAMHPATAASVYALANLYNRAGGSLARRMARGVNK